VLEGKLLCSVGIPHRDKAQPGGLPWGASRKRLLNQAGNRLTGEFSLGIVRHATVHITKTPSEQSAIELLGSGKVGGHQFNKDDLPDMMLFSCGVNQRWQFQFRR
jgi:hypothetical protein